MSASTQLPHPTIRDTASPAVVDAILEARRRPWAFQDQRPEHWPLHAPSPQKAYAQRIAEAERLLQADEPLCHPAIADRCQLPTVAVRDLALALEGRQLREGQPWTPAELELVGKLRAEGVTYREIGARIGRTKAACEDIVGRSSRRRIVVKDPDGEA